MTTIAGSSALLGCALAAGILTVPATAAVARLARARGMVDAPRRDRFHRTPTPLLGGIAIAVVSLLVAAATWGITGTGGSAAAVLLLGCAVLAALGLYDDLTNASPWLRLAVEVVVAAGIVAGGIRLPVTGSVAVDGLATVVLFVVLVNSFNLLDNSDAALGSVAAVTGAGIATLALLWTVADRAPLAAAVVGSAGGFLVWNRPPARIFMGDVGSLFLGAALVGSLGFVADSGQGAQPVVLVAFLLMPLADTTVVMISRIREGRNVLSGGKDHLHHRLARAPLGVAGAALCGAVVSAAGVAVGLAVATGVLAAGVGLLLVLAGWGGLVGWALRQPSGHPVNVPVRT